MKKVLLVILPFLVLIPVAGYIFLRSYLPHYTAEQTVAGLKGKVVIERNAYAVPYLIADNMDDLYFAWGYVNAQDRMFQMEITKRIGQGRISEFAGEKTFKKDLFLRAVGFYDLATREAEGLSGKPKRLLQRYVDGINFFLETEKTPLYMTLLGIEKEKWTLADPIVIGHMLNWTLAYNMRHELLYYEIAKKIGEPRCRELFNLIPRDTPTIASSEKRGRPHNDRLLSLLNNFGPLMGGCSASNNWVIASARTAGSGPILASDPHVHGSKIPSDFYLIRAKSGEFQVTGGQVIGLPFVAFGYNRHMAWGLTNQGADVVDLFFENVDWDKKTYVSKGKELPLGRKEVVFKIKGKNPVKKTLYYAGRRPLMNEIFEGLERDVSLDWAGFEPGGYIRGFFDLNSAGTPAEMVAAANNIHMSPQNMVYAHADGTIGYRTVGTLLRRKTGSGNLPQVSGETGANWDGLVDPNINPSRVNPERGFIATANNKTVEDFPFDMNGTFAPRYRFDRIVGMLERGNPMDVAFMQKMQGDTTSMLARKMIPIMKEYVMVSDDPRAKKALELVTAWDGDVDEKRPEPSIYNTWLVRFMFHTFADELGQELAEQYVGQRYISLERFLVLLDKKSPFFDDVTTPERESARHIATRAFRETLRLLAECTGSREIKDWQWGNIHQIRFDHFLGKSKLMRPFVNCDPLPVKGDGETNHRAHFYEITPPFTAQLASGLRLIVEFDPEPKGQMILITGQNEYFLSSHYKDMTKLWTQGTYFCPEEWKARYVTTWSPGQSGG